VFVRDGVVLAQPFDPTLGQLRGEPESIGAGAVGEFGQFSASQTGRVLAYTGAINPDFQFSWVDHGGRDLASVQQPSNWGNFDLSPDGSHLVTSRGDTLGSGDIWSIDLERGVQTRLTFDDGLDGSPVWSLDGQRIAFTRGLGNPRVECQAVVIPAAGGNEAVAYH
jgi:Tol biopolymer transport system component